MRLQVQPGMGALAVGLAAIRGMGLRALGDCTPDADGNYVCTDPAGSGNDNGGNSGGGDAPPPSGAVCSYYGSDNSCLSYTTNGGLTTTGCGTMTTGACAPAPAGSGSSPVGGQDTCVAAGGVWANNTCTNAGNTGLIAGQQAYNNPTTCAAAGGNWNGSTCMSSSGAPLSAVPVNSLSSFFTSLGRALGTTTLPAGTTVAPAGYMNLGGTLIPYSTVMLVGGILAIVLVMKKK